MHPAEKGAVLIIDDEEGIRAVLKAILSGEDIEALEAATAGDALEALAENKAVVTTCLLDLNLEDCLGEELYDRLRSISPNLAIFVMSGSYDEEIKERFRGREIAGVIAKPFSTKQLLETVQSSLARQN